VPPRDEDVTPGTRRAPQEATGKTGKPTETRNKPERPRDPLGRPLPWGVQGSLALEDFDSLSLEENHDLGRAHARAGEWFAAHEAWETAWKQARDTDEAELFKGLSQMGAGYVHLFRGNAHGAATLLRRAAMRISRYEDGIRGVPTIELAKRLGADADAVEKGDIVPGEGATVAHLEL
jgi:predicted metal-dependent hydrolase